MGAIKYLYIRNKGQGALVKNEILVTMMNKIGLGRIILDSISHSSHLDSIQTKFFLAHSQVKKHGNVLLFIYVFLKFHLFPNTIFTNRF
jgi:hypothetical protein